MSKDDQGARIGGAERARALAVAREFGLTADATRSDLVAALAGSRIAVPSFRPTFDDTDDMHDVVRVIPPGGLRAPYAGWRVVPTTVPSRQPHYKIRVRAVFCADTDGTNATTVTKAHMPALLADLSTLYAAAGLTFVLASVATVHDTMINQDFTVPAGLDYSTPGTQPMTTAQIDASFDEHNAARSAWARKYRGELVIFFRYGTRFRWSDTLARWYVGETSFAFSGPEHEFVAMGPWGPPEAALLAHESGHHFHLGHTHNKLVTLTPAEAKQYADWQTNPAHQAAAAQVLRARLAEGIRAFVDDKGNPPDLGLNVIDADKLADTPPDPGPSIFAYEFGTSCSADSISVDVALQSGPRTYTVSASRDLIMSYFFRCPGLKRFTDAQMDILRASLETVTFTGTVTTPAGNVLPVLSRHHLIAKTMTRSAITVVATPPKSAGRMVRWLRGLAGAGRR
jgi:hypothetical protein